MSVIALISIKGGVGKTTTAIQLAWLAARDGSPTLLWDLDPQGAASYLLRVKPELPDKWGQLLGDPAALAAAIKGTDHPGLDLLPADESCRRLDASLQRADRRGRALDRALAALAAPYAHVLLDCPPGLSFLAENVCVAADALLVPTIPTVLSLRTLAQLARHVAERRGRCPQLLPFLNLVDRHRALHRDVAGHVLRSGGPWLAAAVPYSSALEQVAVQRAPAGSAPAGTAVLRELEGLWAEVRARLARPSDDAERRREALRLAEDLEALARELQPEAATAAAAAAPVPVPEPVPADAESASTASEPSQISIPVPAAAPAGDYAPAPPGASTAAPGAGATRMRACLEVPLASESEVAALLRAAGIPAWPAGGVELLVHAFDTAAGALRAAGIALELCEEGGRYRIAARGPSGAEAAGVDAAWARRILSGESSPLELLAARVGDGAAPWLGALRRLLGAERLARVSSSAGLRRRVAAAQLPIAPQDAAAVPAHALVFERIEGANGRATHALLLDLAPEALPAGEQVLQQLFRQAHVPWPDGAGPDTLGSARRNDAPLASGVARAR